MEQEPQPLPPPLSPHHYPKWVIIFGVLVLALFGYTLVRLPTYIATVKKFNAGARAYQEKDYVKAQELYEEVLAQVPTAKQAQIALAEVYFSNSDSEDDTKGLRILPDKLNKYEYERIKRVMPEAYQFFFRSEKK